MRAAYARNGSKWIRRARRLAIYGRDGWRCVWCTCDVYAPGKSPHGPQFSPVPWTVGWRTEENPLRVATLDHIRPREQGGSNKTENLVTSCMDCNRKRGTKTAADFAVEVAGDFWRRSGATPMPSLASYITTVFTRVLEALTRPLP